MKDTNMDAGKQSCALCAWRTDCQKKFSISGRDMRCPDFARDLSIKNADSETKTSE